MTSNLLVFTSNCNYIIENTGLFKEYELNYICISKNFLNRIFVPQTLNSFFSCSSLI